jgi:hypothetical protein
MGADLTEQIKNLKNLKSGYFGAFSSQKSWVALEFFLWLPSGIFFPCPKKKDTEISPC